MKTLSLSVLVLLFASVSASAAFPSKVTVHLRGKMSCRDVKKLLRPSRLFVRCRTHSMRKDAYAADYFGPQPLDQLITAFSGHEKVESISFGEETHDALAPLGGTLN